MFWTLTPSAIRSKTAMASPASPAQASTRAPPSVSRAYLAVAPSATIPVRSTSEETPSRSADV